jgi:hypothetical protein
MARISASVLAPRPLAVLATSRVRPLLAELLATTTPHVTVLALAELDAAGVVVAEARARLEEIIVSVIAA